MEADISAHSRLTGELSLIIAPRDQKLNFATRLAFSNLLQHRKINLGLMDHRQPLSVLAPNNGPNQLVTLSTSENDSV